MNSEIYANIIKMIEVGLGASFIRVSDKDKYLYKKVNYGAINAIRLYDGQVYNINENEKVLLVIE